MTASSICQFCKGTELIFAESGVIMPCECLVLNRKDRLLREAQIPQRYAAASLDDFGSNYAGAATARRLADAEVRSSKRNGLLLAGHAGTGKTHLAAATLRDQVINHGRSGVFTSASDLLRALRRSYGEGNTEAVDDRFATCDVLVIDDLGLESTTMWGYDSLVALIARRYAAELCLVVTTNYDNSPPDKNRITLGNRIGAAAQDRLNECCFTVRMEGATRRKGDSVRV